MKINILMIFIMLNSINSYAEDKQCGPNSLMAICNNKNIKINMDEIKRLCWFDNDYGATMYGLAYASNKIGLKFYPLKIDYSTLRKLNSPSIVVLNNNHFSVVWDVKRDYVILQEWPNKKYNLNKDFFCKIWNGEALIYSNKNHKKLENKVSEYFTPVLNQKALFLKKHIDTGKVKEGEEIKCTYKVINIGNKPLNLYVRSRCSCLQVSIKKNIILPNETGAIYASTNTKGIAGSQTYYIDVLTNDPDQRKIVLSLNTFVETPVKIYPEKIWIGITKLGTRIEKQVEIIGYNDSTTVIKSIELPDDIQAIEKNISIRDKKIYKPIIITILPNKLGLYSKKIYITTKNNKRMVLEVQGEIIGPYKVVPPTLFMRQVKYKSIVDSKLVIYPTNRKLPKNINIDDEINGGIIKIEKQNGKRGELIVSLSITPVEGSREIKGSIKISSDNNSLFDVPLYCKIND